MAALVSGESKTKQNLLIDVTSHFIGIKVQKANGSYCIRWVVESQSPIPLSETIMVTNNQDNLTQMDFVIFEGKSME